MGRIGCPERCVRNNLRFWNGWTIAEEADRLSRKFGTYQSTLLGLLDSSRWDGYVVPKHPRVTTNIRCVTSNRQGVESCKCGSEPLVSVKWGEFLD